MCLTISKSFLRLQIRGSMFYGLYKCDAFMRYMNLFPAIVSHKQPDLKSKKKITESVKMQQYPFHYCWAAELINCRTTELLNCLSAKLLDCWDAELLSRSCWFADILRCWAAERELLSWSYWAAEMLCCWDAELLQLIFPVWAQSNVCKNHKFSYCWAADC